MSHTYNVNYIQPNKGIFRAGEVSTHGDWWQIFFQKFVNIVFSSIFKTLFRHFTDNAEGFIQQRQKYESYVTQKDLN